MSIASQLLDYLGKHYFEAIVTSVSGLLFLFSIKRPLENWRDERRKVAVARRGMYSALANILMEVEVFASRTKAEVPISVTPWSTQWFCETIYPGKYAAELKAVQSVRSAMFREAEGFDRVIALVDDLPNSKVLVGEKMEALGNFVSKYTVEMRIQNFDPKMLAAAVAELRMEKISMAFSRGREAMRPLLEETQKNLAKLRSLEAEQVRSFKSMRSLESDELEDPPDRAAEPGSGTEPTTNPSSGSGA